MEGGCNHPGSHGDGEAARALAQRLLRQLVQLINLKPNIKDFDVIPVEVNCSNKSPVIHADEHIGVESWCVKYIYDYAYNKLMNEYFVKGQSKKINRNNCDEVDTLSMGALLFNPDVMTFWNKRREMVCKNFLSCSNELKFTKIVLSHKPKSNEVFSYRKWLLNRNFGDPTATFVYLMRDLIEEFSITINCAEKSPNNYHAWSHRIWLMRLLTEHPRFRAQSSMRGKYVMEFCRSEQWISTHISDYSGIHYRQFCLTNVLNMPNFFEHVDHGRFKIQKSLYQFLVDNLEDSGISSEKIINNEKNMVNLILGVVIDSNIDADKYSRIYQNACILIYELKLNEQLSRTYTCHETLWCHRKFVIHQIMSLIFEYFGESRPKANYFPSVLNEKRLAYGSTGNITLGFENMYKSKGIDMTSFGKEPKISRCDNHSTYSSLLYKALSNNERKFIDQRMKSGDTFPQKYELWLRVILKFSF